MKNLSIEIKMVGPQDPTEDMGTKKKPKEITSLADLKSILEDEDPRFTYGGIEFGAIGSKDIDVEDEETSTPDDLASSEDNETRVKNSKNPTIVGKKV